MDARTLFNTTRQSFIHIKGQNTEVDRLRAQLLPAGARYANTRVQTSYTDRIGDVMADIDEIERMLDTEKARTAVLAKDALKLISRLEDPVHRKVLQLRYIDCAGWQQIAERTNYSEGMVYKIHRKALSAAEQVLTADNQTA